MKNFLNSYVAPPVAFLLIWLISVTLRLFVEGGERESALLGQGKNYSLVFWHGRLFYLPYYYRKTAGRFRILASPSVDGEIIARTLKLFGFGVVRGSSFKGAAKALLALARSASDGYCPVLIADGSRGPIYNLQPGALLISKLSGAPALPVTVSFSSYWTLPTWDKLMIPKPFSKVVVIYGTPVTLSRDCGEDALEKARLDMEADMTAITQRADGYFKEPRT
ncbi:MAG: lysophospholipid acyltransferase family protein [Nitrospinae bacterium]|nr:lysophospholipid acyltransferase family protein [Nitrospinota bacterium]